MTSRLARTPFPVLRLRGDKRLGRTERIFRITTLLRDTKSLRFDEILQRLDISPATLKRDLKYLREQLGTPIDYDFFERTYRIRDGGHEGRRELPGLWFGESELLALTFAYRLLEQIDPQQKMAPRLKSVIQRIGRLMHTQEGYAELLERVRLVLPGKREVNGETFDAISTALMRRRQVRLQYFTRSRHTARKCSVSPQRIVFYRTWYLDAWCHEANALRRFALDAVENAQALEAPSKEVPLGEIECLFDGVYGSFAGEPNRWATLVFSKEVAQWLSKETWHPLQRMRTLTDGRLQLVLPYRDPTELVMDLMRYGDQVEVQGDDQLFNAVRDRVHALASRYRLA